MLGFHILNLVCTMRLLNLRTLPELSELLQNLKVDTQNQASDLNPEVCHAV